MSFPDKSPFGRIDAAVEYLTLLVSTVMENRELIETEIIEVTEQKNQRGVEVLTLVAYNLEKLEKHLVAGRQTLNDLGKLRRLLLNGCMERAASQENVSEIFLPQVADVPGQLIRPASS